MAENEIQAVTFDLSAGQLSLDFANTLDDRLSASPREYLNSYHDLVSWSQQAQTVTDSEARLLQKEAEKHPAKASGVLQEAIVLREALFRIFSAVAEGESSENEDLNLLNSALSEAMCHVRIVPQTGGFQWDWRAGPENLDRVLWPVIRSAADLLTSDELSETRVCASEDCNWLFLDTSKNHSRRWCNMKTCGNRAKARRHYERTR
ncbi:MAG TPA: ABATE domain-containing protein [Ktedonobacteraceae bacterium]